MLKNNYLGILNLYIYIIKGLEVTEIVGVEPKIYLAKFQTLKKLQVVLSYY